MSFKEVDVTELELGQFCYDVGGRLKTTFIYCGTNDDGAWFYPTDNIGAYTPIMETDGTIVFPEKNDTWYEEV